MEARERAKESRPTTTVRKNVLVDCHVRAEFSNSYWFDTDDIEKNAKRMESRCKEFNDFIRDHRSQDDVSLSVEREFADKCAACDHQWEQMEFEDDNGKYQGCAWCGAALEKGEEPK